MEQEVLRLLAEFQSPLEGPRRSAEAQINELFGNDAFPMLLAHIASTAQLGVTARQAALLVLKRFVQHCWSRGFEEFTGPLVNDGVRSQLKGVLLPLIADEQRKIRTVAAYVVSKIASTDFPEQWPNLLPDLLDLITKGNEHQVHGALRVLNDLVDDGFSDEQFFVVAKQLVQVAYGVAANENGSYSIRALAVLIFYSCVETLEMVKVDHKEAVTGFAQESLDIWVPFFLSVLDKTLSGRADESFNGCVTLKVQVLRTVMQIRKVFPALVTPFLGEVFLSTWKELNAVKDRYVHDFIINESEGKLVDLDGLPYSLDLLVLEQLDFIQTCLKSKPVRDELQRASQGAGTGSPLEEMVLATLALSQVTSEDEGMWEVDLNVFLCEESAVSANYTPRTASGDLILKLGEWFRSETEAFLWAHTERIFNSGESRQMKEAALFAWDQLLSEFADINLKISPARVAGLLGYVVAAIGSNGKDNQFLRARGYFLAGTLTKSNFETIGPQVTELVRQTLNGATGDPSDIVKISCIKVFRRYCENVQHEVMRDYQLATISAIRAFLAITEQDDAEDSQDVLGELLETLRAAVGLNHSAVLDPSLQMFDLVFAIAQKRPRSAHLTGLIHDIIEDIAEELHSSFVSLCGLVLPFVTIFLDLTRDGKDHPLVNLGADILAVLAHNGSEPLPNGFVATIVPRLSRILLNSQDVEALQSGCEAFKEIVKHDIKQLLEWSDGTGKPGLEVTLMIIDRLLRPDVPEASALEVGGLAAEVVEKASDHLGPYLPELLGAVAHRLATAKQPPFIQNLILVFARLVLRQAKDVVDFLAGLSIGGVNGLQVVIAAWLEGSSTFTGYDEIRQNVFALCQLYRLEDPRLSQIMVQGDLIVPKSNRIMTRSQAKQNPDQYTSVPVPVKIIQLLVLELGPSIGDISFSNVINAHANEDDSEDEDWEDTPDGLNVPGFSREELMALGSSGRQSRQTDDATYSYLTSFFREVSSQNIGNFGNIYSTLKPEEQHQLSLLGSS